MKYDINDSDIIRQMALAALSYVETRDLARFQSLADAVAGGIKASKAPAATARKLGDAYLATAIMLLLEGTPNPQAICDLAIAKGEQMDALHAHAQIAKVNVWKAVGQA